ncbi:unnamed protein product, partial [marine sediment metagenome]
MDILSMNGDPYRYRDPVFPQMLNSFHRPGET